MLTKNLMGEGGNFHGGKLTSENAPKEKCFPEICPPSFKGKKRKKRKLISEKIIS